MTALRLSPRMNIPVKWLFASWVMLTILGGSILTSLHQPFNVPTTAILKLAQPAANHQMRAVHILAGSCACSQRVMQHLIDRKPLTGVSEQVILLDGPAPDLPTTTNLVASLSAAGFTVSRVKADAVPADAALRGVPLLIFAAPNNTLLYMGGYGPSFDQDSAIFHQLQQKQRVTPLAATGCAVSQRMRRQADPFHIKY